MRILIADDNDLIRRALRNLLARESGWTVCGEAADGPDAIQKARELRPDLVLLDISMPFGNGFDAARVLRQEIPDVRILILSQQEAGLILPSALEAGADGCVDKSQIAYDLVSAVKRLSFKIGPDSATG